MSNKINGIEISQMTVAKKLPSEKELIMTDNFLKDSLRGTFGIIPFFAFTSLFGTIVKPRLPYSMYVRANPSSNKFRLVNLFTSYFNTEFYKDCGYTKWSSHMRINRPVSEVCIAEYQSYLTKRGKISSPTPKKSIFAFEVKLNIPGIHFFPAILFSEVDRDDIFEYWNTKYKNTFIGEFIKKLNFYVDLSELDFSSARNYIPKRVDGFFNAKFYDELVEAYPQYLYKAHTMRETLLNSKKSYTNWEVELMVLVQMTLDFLKNKGYELSNNLIEFIKSMVSDKQKQLKKLHEYSSFIRAKFVEFVRKCVKNNQKEFVFGGLTTYYLTSLGINEFSNFIDDSLYDSKFFILDIFGCCSSKHNSWRDVEGNKIMGYKIHIPKQLLDSKGDVLWEM